MPNYFYDASALVKRYHTEQGSSIINPLFDGEARHFISELSVVEIHTAFSKKKAYERNYHGRGIAAGACPVLK